jgi:hypothetical protein
MLWGATGCTTLAGPPTTPTLDITQVYATVSAMLTSTLAAPTAVEQTATPQPPATATLTNSTSSQPATLAPVSPATVPAATTGTLATQGALQPTLACDRAAAGAPIDITIPDDTQMEAGENFIKVWKLQNAGSCTWTAEYAAIFFYGEQMAAPESVPLAEAVPPGQSIEIAIEMTAPEEPGSYQGNWKLRNAAGDFFGIGPDGDSPFWVRIVVVEQATETPTPTFLPTSTASPSPTPTLTPTATATPPIQAGGTFEMLPGDPLDLDMAELNPGAGADLIYQTGESDHHWLVLQEGTQLGIYGSLEPGLAECQAANMSEAPVAVESLPAGIYLCYLTSEGRFGRAQVVKMDETTFTLTISILTWAAP